MNQGFKALIPSTAFDVDFLYYLFQFFKNKFIKKACGSTFLELSKRDFMRERFKIPTIEEQRTITAVLNTCEKQIESLTLDQDGLKEQKIALMQQLLNGKRRVKFDDENGPRAAMG